MNQKNAVPVMTALCLALLGAGPAASAAAPKPAELDWLKTNALPLKTCEAGRGFDDLAPFKSIVGKARIVSLGECTHGTREVFQMKHRFLEYLASQCGFTIFSIEASMPEAYRLNEYVLEGKGDPAKLIGGMYFWTWNTEEVLAMVQWMRQFNQSGKGRLEFTGFDMQTPDVAMENVTRFVRTNDPARAKGIEETYRQVLKARLRKVGGRAGVDFGVATGTFPVDAAKGKKIRYSGWIKTAGVTRGFAGLWWRADGEAGVLAFDNMQTREIKGTTDWKEYEVALEIPEQTININFGVLLPGDGKAWFDDLKVEIAGQEYDPAGRFDFGFESGALKGFFTAGSGYRVVVDDQEAHTGKHSLRLELVGGDRETDGGLDPTAAAKECGKILAELEAGRDRYLKAGSAKETEWAIQNARVVHQCLQVEAQQAQRDECMASNVKWILDHAPEHARIVLWAHNGHVCRMKYSGAKAMGACLAEMYGKEQLVVGFAAGEGRYTAVAPNKGLRSDNALQAPPESSYEAWFRASRIPSFYLDLRKATQDDPGSGWLRRSLSFRSIGALAMDEQFSPANPCDLFDVITYFDQTTASRLLPGAGGKPRKD
jgi:erythromycin esterase-like protein